MRTALAVPLLSLGFVAPGLAQTRHTIVPETMPGPARFAGTYHAATGMWTRSALTSAFGLTEVLYSNTTGNGYFSALVGPTGPAAGGTIVEAAQIPSTSSPVPFVLGGSGRDSSLVDVVQIGYCDLDPMPGVSGWRIDFYNAYNPCTFPPAPAQLAGTATVVGAPSNGCWFFNVDVTDFVLLHDGDGTNDGDPSLDSFGIEWRYTGAGSAAAGLLVAGDPARTDASWVPGTPPSAGSNTYYGAPSLCLAGGSGYLHGDFLWVEDSAGTGGLSAGSNCYFFGGYDNGGSQCTDTPMTPYAAFHIEIAGLQDEIPPCICNPGCIGYPNATGVPGEIEVTGDPIAANNDVVLRSFSLPPFQFGIFATGLQPIAPGLINSGNGTVCIDPGAQGGLGRFAGANQIKNTGATGEMALDTNAGDWDLSMIPTSSGTYAAVAGITSHFQAWHREPVGAGFNFSNSTAVVWQ